MNEDIASLQAAIDSMRIELTEAYEEISDLRFRLEKLKQSSDAIVILDKAVDDLIKERDEAYEQLDRYKNGFEGSCMACEPVGEMNKKLRAERDEARRSCCEFAAIVDGADTADGMESGRFYEIAMRYMKDRGWDCYKEDGK
jgi:regulator of replication initiation timing